MFAYEANEPTVKVNGKDFPLKIVGNPTGIQLAKNCDGNWEGTVVLDCHADLTDFGEAILLPDGGRIGVAKAERN